MQARSPRHANTRKRGRARTERERERESLRERGRNASANCGGLKDLAIAVRGVGAAEQFALLENTLIRIRAAESETLFLGAKIALAVPLHAQQLATVVAQPGHLAPWIDHAESAAGKIIDPEETLYVRISYMLLCSRCRRACLLSGALLDSESRPCQVGGVLDPWQCKARPKARESARVANFGKCCEQAHGTRRRGDERISPGQVPKSSIGSPICDERRAQDLFRRSRRADGAASTCRGRGGGGSNAAAAAAASECQGRGFARPQAVKPTYG
jgi:hypothetical protein